MVELCADELPSPAGSAGLTVDGGGRRVVAGGRFDSIDALLLLVALISS